MAGAGYGVTPMSRLSKHSSRRRHSSPQAGKLLDLDPSNTAATSTRKKTPKRKTLSSRYTAELPSKRRKLGIDTISGPADAASAALSPEVCHSTESNHKERESKHLSTKGRARKARAKVKAKARAKARIKANGVQGDLIAKVSKVLASKANTNQSPFGESDLKAKLLTLNENTRAGHFHEGNRKWDLSTSPLEKVNSKARTPSESKQVGSLLLDKIGELQKQDTDEQAQVLNRGLGRKNSSKWFTSSSFEPRAERDHNAAEPSGTASPSLLLESQPPGSSLEDSIDGSLYSRQDSGPSEGRFLRPRRHARKKSKFDNQRLPPSDYVGKRVVVYWPHAKAWFAGKVIQYDDSTKKHKIKYDDNDEECISFRRHKVVLEKSPSVQSADCATSFKEAGRSSAEHHLVGKDGETDLEPCKSGHLQEDFDEDNALLSAFALRPRVRDASHEQSCNGSVKPVGAGKRISSKDSPVQKASKARMSSAVQENTGRTGADEKVHTSGTRGAEAAFVYVRRTKDRQKDDGSLIGITPNGRLNDCDSMSGARQQGRPRKRKKSQQPLVQQLAQVDFLHGRYSDTYINPPVVPDTCEENGGGGSVSEHSSRKRNKRSLKKLVSQVLVMQGTEVVQELEPRRGRKRERGSKRRGRKLMRKHKLARLVSSARDRRFSTERIFDDAGGLVISDEAEGLTHAFDGIELQGGEALLHVLESYGSFCHTIHLVLPVVIPELFTWQLFSILASVNFCEGSPFDDRFSLKGSLQDWKSIFRVTLGIVKAVPLSTWINGRQWQRRILHEMWNAMPRCGPLLTDMFSFLPVKAETAIVELFKGAISNCMMTSRQIMNLFVCFFIKPYVVATICAKGASFKLFVQQVLLLEGSKDGDITCLRQSLRSFPVHTSSGSAESDFASYLMLFPRSTDWCTTQGLFGRQMKRWIESAACAGYAEKWLPVSTIKKRNNLGWEITSAHFVNHGCSIDETKSKIFKIEQGTARLGSSSNSRTYCPRHAEERLFRIDQNDGWAIGLRDCHCLSSALLFTSFLQRFLYEGLGARLSSSSTAKYLVPSKIPVKDDRSIQFARKKLIGVKEESGFGTRVVPIGRVLAKQVKTEPDMVFSRQNFSVTTESNDPAVKEESSVEMYGHQQTLGQFSNGFPLESYEQHFSGQIDQEYYLHKRSKDTKKVKTSRLRPRGEEVYSSHDEPSTFCCADLLFKDGGRVLKKRDVQVEVQPNGKIDFLVAVHVNGEVVGRRLNQVSTLGSNPPELRWKSGFGWALDFPNREQWELFRSVYNELCIRTVQGITKEIPIPVFKDTELLTGADGESSSTRPFFAIRYQEDEISVAFKKGRILYDLDSEDESWLKEINKESGGNFRHYRLAISDDVLERMIDRLEKEAYKRGDHCFDVHDAIEVCQDLGEADVVRAVHTYWSNKRLAKGKALLRYFQPLLWEQYQEELRTWEARMENCPPNVQSMLLERYPRPMMSAFCLQSRTLDACDTSRRVLRQRSQRKIRPPSRSSSEESYRLPAARYRDSTWHMTNQFQHAEPVTPLAIGSHMHALRNEARRKEDREETEEAKAARATAVEARKVATVRATKLQRRLLEFDSLLHRACTSLMEYEAVAGVKATAQCEALEGRMSRLFSRCARLLQKGDDSSDDDDTPSQSRRVCKDVGPEFLDAFARKCSLNGKMVICGRAGELDFGCDTGEEASPLLPISVKASSYSWNGSSLL